MVEVDVKKKYSNFMAPKVQIFLDQKDISTIYKITPASLIVEEVSTQFTLDDASAWINSPLFKVGMDLKIKMGYMNATEIVFEGKIIAVQTVFPGNGPPQLIVFGKETATNRSAADTFVPLFYGDTLNSFTSTIEEDVKSKFCVAECIGLPDVKVGVIVAIAGLGSQFDQSYIVEKAVHTFDCMQGFRTKFEAKTLYIAEKLDFQTGRNLLRKGR